jgi:hypothetical protein
MIIKIVRLCVLTIVAVTFQAGCEPPMLEVGQSQGKALQYPDTGIPKRICLLPVMRRNDLNGTYDDSPSQDALCQKLETLSRQRLEQGGFEVIQLKDLPEESRQAAEKELAEIRSHLKDVMNQFRPKDSVRDNLSRLGVLAEVQTVVLLNAQIRLGRSGSWNPNTGEILPDESTANIKAVVLSCQDGHQQWSNEVFMRRNINMNELEKATKILFCSKPNSAK